MGSGQPAPFFILVRRWCGCCCFLSNPSLSDTPCCCVSQRMGNIDFHGWTFKNISPFIDSSEGWLSFSGGGGGGWEDGWIDRWMMPRSSRVVLMGKLKELEMFEWLPNLLSGGSLKRGDGLLLTRTSCGRSLQSSARDQQKSERRREWASVCLPVT